MIKLYSATSAKAQKSVMPKEDVDSKTTGHGKVDYANESRRVEQSKAEQPRMNPADEQN